MTKISIVPRGAAGGLTFFAPSDERLDSGLYRCVPCCVCWHPVPRSAPTLPRGCTWLRELAVSLLFAAACELAIAVAHVRSTRACSRSLVPATCWHHVRGVQPFRADRLHVTCSKSYLENQLAVALGGRVAEELIFGVENVTTGASNDFQQVGLLQPASVLIMAICPSYLDRQQAALRSSGRPWCLPRTPSTQCDWGGWCSHSELIPRSPCSPVSRLLLPVSGGRPWQPC